MILINLLIIVLFISLNAFFVAVEYAVVASRRSRLETVEEKETKAKKIVRTWLEDPLQRDRLIAANQVAITLINLAVGALSENTFSAIFMPIFTRIQLLPQFAFLEKALESLPIILGLLIATGLQVVFGELVPKVAVLRSPEKFALLSAPWMRGFVYIFRYFISLLEGSARFVLSIFGIDARDAHPSSMSVDEMKVMFSGPEMEGVIEEKERDMLSAVLDFSGMVVRQVSIPRTEIIALESSATLPEIIKAFSENHVSKLPVYTDSMDQIVGILHVRDLIQVLQKPDEQRVTAGDLAREVLFVPETISVNDLLNQFRAKRQHLAIVVDEFGGTAGLVTLEDLVEEIVGDYRDSFESAQPPIQTVSAGNTLVDGLTLMSDLNEHLDIHLHDPDYDTVAGFILGRLSRIPKVGDVVEEPELGIKLTVHSMDRLRISQVMITRLDKKTAHSA
jgi:CBS domain containing-hemolysin-like protein